MFMLVKSGTPSFFNSPCGLLELSVRMQIPDLTNTYIRDGGTQVLTTLVEQSTTLVHHEIFTAQDILKLSGFCYFKNVSFVLQNLIIF